MQLLVCGSRTITTTEYMFHVLDHYPRLSEVTRFIEGAAKGADTLAGNYAIVHNIGLHEVEAEWQKYGRRAGYLRNKAMLDMLQPGDEVIAFVDKPLAESKGTAMMVKLAQDAGFTVHVFRVDTQHREF